MEKLFYSWDQFDKDVEEIVNWVKENHPDIKYIYGVPNGGLPLAVCLKNRLNLSLLLNLKSKLSLSLLLDLKEKGEKILIVDDIADTGKTLLTLNEDVLSDKDGVHVTLFYKPQSQFKPDYISTTCKNDDWVVFPWEPEEKEMKRDGTAE